MQKVQSWLDKLLPDEQAMLIEQLARQLAKAVALRPAPPQDLYGIWKDKFPPDLDLDAALREMRQEWQTEWKPGKGFVE